jgi:hypothetical protein
LTIAIFDAAFDAPKTTSLSRNENISHKCAAFTKIDTTLVLPAISSSRTTRASTVDDPYLPAATVVDVIGEPGRALRRGRGGGG